MFIVVKLYTLWVRIMNFSHSQPVEQNSIALSEFVSRENAGKMCNDKRLLPPISSTTRTMCDLHEKNFVCERTLLAFNVVQILNTLAVSTISLIRRGGPVSHFSHLCKRYELCGYLVMVH